MGVDPGEDLPPRYRVQPVERGNGYAVYLVFLEMPGAQHHGFVVTRGAVSVPKGVLAAHLRGLLLQGVESVIAPPADSNALLMARLSDTTPPATLDTLAREARRYLEAEGFFSDAARPSAEGPTRRS